VNTVGHGRGLPGGAAQTGVGHTGDLADRFQSNAAQREVPWQRRQATKSSASATVEPGGAPTRRDDDGLARRTERERVDAGIEDYDPDDVPPAADAEPLTNPTDTESYREETAEVRREIEEGELYPLTEKQPLPPTRYDRS
jgi:hypothetical protein